MNLHLSSLGCYLSSTRSAVCQVGSRLIMAVRKTRLMVLLILLALVAALGGVFVIGKRAHQQWIALKSHLNAIQHASEAASRATEAASRATESASRATEAANRATEAAARVSGLGTLGTLAVAPLDAENR